MNSIIYNVYCKDSKFIGKNSVHLNNQLSGTNVMPMKSQTSSNGGGYSMMRQIFQNTPRFIQK